MKSLRELLPKHSGRDTAGHVAVRHQGGRHKRFYREIDWLRDKIGIPGVVLSIEYDPNRTVDIALISYADGEKRYILAPIGLKVGSKITNGPDSDIRVGNALPIGSMPIGTVIHNLEIKPGHGAQMIRSAGASAVILSKEEKTAQIKLPSGEIRVFDCRVMATVGQLGNEDWQNQELGSAGASRHRGIRPGVRGVAQNPRSHPHGGGEGRSGIGMPSPKSPWGKRTLGKKTRKPTKYSDRFILERKSR